MATTTIALPEDLAKQLKILKIEENYKNMGELLERLLIEYKKAKFLAVSKKFRQRMKKKGLKLEDLI